MLIPISYNTVAYVLNWSHISDISNNNWINGEQCDRYRSPFTYMPLIDSGLKTYRRLRQNVRVSDEGSYTLLKDSLIHY